MLTGAQELPRTCLRDHFWVEVKRQINSSVSTSVAEFNFSNRDEGHFICALSSSLLICSTVYVTWLVLCVLHNSAPLYHEQFVSWCHPMYVIQRQRNSPFVFLL